MKDPDSSPLKSAALNLLLATVWAVVICAVFVGVASIRVGLLNLHRQGFWVPILTGTLTIIIVPALAFPAMKKLRLVFRSKNYDSESRIFGMIGGHERKKAGQ